MKDIFFQEKLFVKKNAGVKGSHKGNMRPICSVHRSTMIFGLLAVFLFLLLGCPLSSSSSDSSSTSTSNSNSNDTAKDTCYSNDNAQTFTHNGENREYILYVPNSYSSQTPAPLMFNFHGYGGVASEYMKEADMRSVADTNAFILVYPQGLCLSGSSHWNSALSGGDNKSSIDDLGFVESLITHLASSYNIDTQRVYASGYSNGGMMSYALACYKSNVIAAIASVSGVMLDTSASCAPTHPLSVISIHGTTDGVLPYGGSTFYTSIAATITFWTGFNDTNTSPTTTNLNSGSTQVERQVYAAKTNGTKSTSVEHYKIINGGHVWFDLSINGKNTADLVWDFVSQYKISGRI